MLEDGCYRYIHQRREHYEDSLLFLDEIQATPNALQALRYFYEERADLPVVAAGSLLEFALSTHSFSMPVGRVQYLHMGPMTFRESVPRMLGQKIKYVNLASGERAARVRTMIHRLAKAQVVLPVFHSHCSGLPLGADIDDSVFKLAFLDVGLANHLCGLAWRDISDADDTRLVNEGGMAEQYVAQQLAWFGRSKPELTYWHREGRQGNAEIDFALAVGPIIYPVEVKAGKSGTLKSLDQFILHKRLNTALRFDLNPPSRQTVTHSARTPTGNEAVTYERLSLPLYAIGELPRLLEEHRAASS
jgi:predicted AAA+ superfamily ATPase